MSVYDQLMAATKVKEVTDFIIALQNERVINWRSVDDNENNLATINLGSDPAAGLVERLTNAFDAVLDFEWLKRGQPTSVMSPRAATEQWFSIPSGRLSNLSDLRDPGVVSLTERVEVALRDSERDDRPTIDVRDLGIGIKAEEFATSILSLHKSRKLKKLFLAGAFGQGGSTALAYSTFTVIISRPSVVPDQPDRSNDLAFTIVRFNAGDPDTDKHGVYEYLVDNATGHPITITAPDEFAPGTLVRHVSMDIGKYKNVLTAPTGSLWFLAHNYLFDPVLPFRLVERRTNKAASQRTAAGNYRLLSKGEHTEYQRSASLTFRSGMVSITWWVLSAEGEQARQRLTQYVMPSKPVVVTYNGQKQGDFSNSLIKNDLRLPYLERYIIVHVDCDHLDNESRRQLFPTTRETIRDTPIGDDLKRLIVDTLSGDSELQRLDDERKRRYLQRADTAAIENIRRRLSNRVRAVIQSSGGGKGPRVLPPDVPPKPNPQPTIPIQEPPTFVDIVSPEPRKVYAGKRFTIRFRTDADPAYFMRPDSFIAIIDPPSFGQYSGTTNVRDGYGVVYFNASDDLEVGTEAKITLEVRPRRAQSLHASVGIEVVPLPESAQSGEGGSVATPNINPQWVTEGDPFWTDNNWNRQSVAKVVRSGDSIEIYVSANNEKLVSLVTRAQRRNVEAVDAIKDFYLEHVSFHAFLESLDQEKTQTEDEENSPRRGEQNHELSRACETVCGIADATFEVIVTASEIMDMEPEPEDMPGA
jgi:hypothetical protein